jgi:DNA-directed RNA polymerase sigma subunit (sigma70/sigma32)
MSGQQERREYVETQDVPTTVELYRREVRSLPRFTRAEEQELVRRARGGDADARTALIQSCLNYVGFMAAWHARYVVHDEYLDLVGIGNVAVVEHVDEALTRENPCAYLRGCAKFAIIYHCFNRDSLIPTPWQAKQRISVTSLDTPVYANTVQAEPVVVRESPDYSWLYQAMEQLPPRYQEVLIRRFGLYDRPVESLYAMSRRMSTSVKGSIAYLTEYRALRRLRQLLTQQEERTLLPKKSGEASTLS